MSGETYSKVEAMLEPLIRQHGLERVQNDLAALIPKSRWSDYQTVYALARNINNRIERFKPFKAEGRAP